MSLGADVTCQLEGVHHLLLSLPHLSQGIASFESHLEVETKDLQQLLICCLESNVLAAAVGPRLALNNDLDYFILVCNWLSQELRVLVPILDGIRVVEACLDFA